MHIMDINKLAEELKTTKPFPDMAPEIFFALKKLLPLLAIELLIINKNGEFALVQKKGQFNGWALPGGFLGLNEGMETACQRIAKRYLGTKVSKATFLNICNLPEEIYGEGNGHAVVLIFKCNLPKSAKNITYFKKVPKDILRHHKIILKSALGQIGVK